MFSRLPESNAQRQKRSGGFVVSTGVHVVLIALAVRATALTAKPPDRATIEPVHFVAPEPHRPTMPPETPARARASSGPTSPTRVAPPPQVDWKDIPNTIPSPGSMDDLIREVAFDRPRIATSGGGTSTSPNVSDGQPLTERYVDRPVVALPGSAEPRYPSLLQNAGVEGDVRAQFVVDTLGHVEPTSVRILESTHEGFSQAVRNALVRARFVPAEAGGRKVRQLVEQPFSFKLTGR